MFGISPLTMYFFLNPQKQKLQKEDLQHYLI